MKINDSYFIAGVIINVNYEEVADFYNLKTVAVENPADLQHETVENVPAITDDATPAMLNPPIQESSDLLASDVEEEESTPLQDIQNSKCHKELN